MFPPGCAATHWCATESTVPVLTFPLHYAAMISSMALHLLLLFAPWAIHRSAAFGSEREPIEYAPWVIVETKPLRGDGQPVVRSMLRHNAIEAWETIQKTGGWKRCPIKGLDSPSCRHAKCRIKRFVAEPIDDFYKRSLGHSIVFHGTCRSIHRGLEKVLYLRR